MTRTLFIGTKVWVRFQINSSSPSIIKRKMSNHIVNNLYSLGTTFKKLDNVLDLFTIIQSTETLEMEVLIKMENIKKKFKI